MKQVITTERIPIKMWLHDIDEQAMQQAKNIANLPFAFSHICLMPDTHVGYGMPIGGVFASKNVIIPNAVGVDIGCGMCAVKTNIQADSLSKKQITSMFSDVRKAIPLGHAHHQDLQDETLMPEYDTIDNLPIVRQQYHSARKQLGTLGGGNHFIEIQKDQDEFIWIMIHSGSRNLGKKVAEYYNNKAEKLNALWYSAISQKNELAFLPFETDEARLYFREMKYCIEFAFANRKCMINRMMQIITDYISDINFEPIINIAHNYAAFETHFDTTVIMHRKGATSAKAGETGIIPGSQGTKSYIVNGKGNPESFMSCSHGAGRLLGRKQAKRSLNLQEEIDKMNALGIIHAIRTQNDLEEAASAYKNIDEVMLLQQDLVEIVHELTPIGVIKA